MFFFKSMVPIIILPLSFVFIIAGTSEKLDFMNIYFKIGTILLLISNFVIMYVAYKVNESEKLRIKLYDNKIKEDINKLYYELIEQKYNANRIYIHDLNKHINILNAMMIHEQYTDMKLYLQTMFEVSKKMSNQIYSGKSVHLYDMMTILYNTLENAVESCCEKGGIIRISFRVEETNYIFFKIINTSYKKDKMILKTNKKDSDKHGIGVISIKNTVENLNGSVRYTNDIKNKLFSTTIILPCTDIVEQN